MCIRDRIKRSLTLPGDVYAGRVDPKSVEGIDRAYEMAGVFSPMNPATRSGGYAIPGMRQGMVPKKVEAPTSAALKQAARCRLYTSRMSVSRDGGATFGNYREAEIGRQGKYRQGVRFNRLGTASAKGAQIQLDYSDPPPFTLFSGNLVVEPRG